MEFGRRITTVLIAVLVIINLIGCGALEEKTKNKVAIETLLEEFEACKEASEDRNSCKHFTAEAICKYNGISDFELEDGSYTHYDELLDEIVTSPHWSFLGDANNQETLDNAQDLANRGYPVVCIDTKGSSHFIVLIIEGEMEKSSKWDLNCPNSAAFFPRSRPESYINKTLNYAFKKPKGLEIFVRK